MDRLWLQTLGDLALKEERGTSDALIGPSKSLGVLAYLAAVPGGEATRDHVARLLWPGFESSRARRSLRQALYYLSRQAGRTLVETGNGDLGVVESALDVDLWAFEDALQEADYERAVALYDGPFLDGFSVDGAREFEGWVETRNERIWSGLKVAYHEIVTHALDGGDPGKAVRYGRAYVELNPLDESAREALIEAHLARGHRVDAYRTYEEYRRLLDEQLDDEPSASLRRRVEGLEEAIFRWSDDEAAAESRPEEPPASPAHRAVPDAGPPRSAGSDGRAEPGGSPASGRSGREGTRSSGSGGATSADGGQRHSGSRPALARRAGWALAGGIVAVLAITAVAATGWLPFEGAADATSAWEGASGDIPVLLRTDSGGTRASVAVRNGEARLVPDDLGRTDALSPGGTWRAERVTGSGGPDLRIVRAGSGRVAARVATPADEKALTWSPDGRRLLLQAGWLDKESGDYRRRLRVVDRTTGATTELPVSLPVPRESVAAAAWSPTGLRIAFSFPSERGDQDVVVTRADGTSMRTVGGGPEWDGHPAWSPRGRWLVFASGPEGATDLYMTGAAGGSPTRLTSGPGAELHPRWLTSRHLVYLRRRPGNGNAGTLRLMDVETRRTRTLLEGRRLEGIYRGRAPAPDPGARVQRVAIQGLEEPVSPGLRTELRAVAITAAGDTLPTSRVPWRWSVGDTAVARPVESGGLVVRDTGRARVTVSAAGWRSDTAVLRSLPVRRRSAWALLAEDWSEGIDSGRWEIVGEPEPYLVPAGEAGGPGQTLRGGAVVGPGEGIGGGPGGRTPPSPRAFVNNGDENYDSGVVSRRPFRIGQGCTIEFWARVPFTSDLFQSLAIFLYPGDRGPSATGGHNASRFATVQMAPGEDGLELGMGGASVSLEPIERTDRWHRYALQIHEDGRASWVVDGVIRWRSAGVFLEDLPETARLFVGGRSLGTEIRVGPVRVWRGVRYVAGRG